MVTGHPGSQMLEVPDGIPDEQFIGTMSEIPCQSFIGSGKIRDHGSLVELKNGLRGFSLLPEGLGEFEAGSMKPLTTFRTMLPGMLRPEVGESGRKMGILHGVDLRFPVALWRATITAVRHG